MAPKDAQVIVVALAWVSFVAAALWFSMWYTERHLRRWAADRGYELLEWHFSPFWRGPRAFRRFRWQSDYRVAVHEPRRERRRDGWLMVDWPIFGIGAPKVKAWWDGCMPEYDEH